MDDIVDSALEREDSVAALLSSSLGQIGANVPEQRSAVVDVFASTLADAPDDPAELIGPLITIGETAPDAVRPAIDALARVDWWYDADEETYDALDRLFAAAPGSLEPLLSAFVGRLERSANTRERETAAAGILEHADATPETDELVPIDLYNRLLLAPDPPEIQAHVAATLAITGTDTEHVEYAVERLRSFLASEGAETAARCLERVAGHDPDRLRPIIGTVAAHDERVPDRAVEALATADPMFVLPSRTLLAERPWFLGGTSESQTGPGERLVETWPYLGPAFDEQLRERRRGANPKRQADLLALLGTVCTKQATRELATATDHVHPDVRAAAERRERTLLNEFARDAPGAPNDPTEWGVADVDDVACRLAHPTTEVRRETCETLVDIANQNDELKQRVQLHLLCRLVAATLGAEQLPAPAIEGLERLAPAREATVCGEPDGGSVADRRDRIAALLRRLCTASNPVIRGQAVCAISHLFGPDASQFDTVPAAILCSLESLLADDDPVVRERTTRAIGQLSAITEETIGHVEILNAQLGGPAHVEEAAVEALGEIGVAHPEVRAAVADTLVGPLAAAKRGVRFRAATALADLCSRDEAIARRVGPELATRFRTESPAEGDDPSAPLVQLALVRALQFVPGPTLNAAGDLAAPLVRYLQRDPGAERGVVAAESTLVTLAEERPADVHDTFIALEPFGDMDAVDLEEQPWRSLFSALIPVAAERHDIDSTIGAHLLGAREHGPEHPQMARYHAMLGHPAYQTTADPETLVPEECATFLLEASPETRAEQGADVLDWEIDHAEIFTKLCEKHDPNDSRNLFGFPEAVTLVAQHLPDPTDHPRCREAVILFLDCLSDDDWPVRQRTVEQMPALADAGCLCADEAVTHLLSRLTDETAAVRRAAAAAIGDIAADTELGIRGILRMMESWCERAATNAARRGAVLVIGELGIKHRFVRESCRQKLRQRTDTEDTVTNLQATEMLEELT